MLRGWADYIVLDEQDIKDRDWSLDIGGLNFEFLFNFRIMLMVTWGLPKRWEFWEKDFHS
jgi:hypothetical protein